MPLDTSIPLQVKTPEYNPLQQALQVAQFRYMNANGLAQQQAVNANRATSQAYQQAVDPTTGQLDTNKLSSLIAANPDSAYNYAATMKGVQDMRQAQQTYDKGQIGLNSDQIDNYKKGLSFMTQQFATLDPNDPNFNAKMLTIGTDAVKLGHIDPNMVISTMSQIPQDPNQRAMWFKQKLNAMQDATAQLNNLKPATGSVNTGGGTMTTNTDPLTGAVTKTGYIPNTISPDVAASLVDVTNPDGSHSKVPTAQVLQQTGLAGVLPPQAFPQGTANIGGATPGSGRYPATVTPGFQTQPAAGVVEAVGKANAAGGDQWVTDQQSNANSNTRINTLSNALTALQSATTGTGADKLQALKSAIMTFSPSDWGKYLPGVDQNKIASYDEANKYLTQYAQQKAAGMGHGTDAQLSAAITGNGNTHISNLAAQDVVKVNIGLERMEQARTAAFQEQLDAGTLKPSDYSSWKSKFGSTMDPRVFVADQLSPQQFKAMVGKMPAPQQQTFRNQYNWAVQNGYIGDPRSQ